MLYLIYICSHHLSKNMNTTKDEISDAYELVTEEVHEEGMMTRAGAAVQGAIGAVTGGGTRGYSDDSIRSAIRSHFKKMIKDLSKMKGKKLIDSNAKEIIKQEMEAAMKDLDKQGVKNRDKKGVYATSKDIANKIIAKGQSL